MSMLYEFQVSFMRGARATVKYCYFAPLMAMFFTISRRGGYFWHLRALYRLCFWRGRKYPETPK